MSPQYNLFTPHANRALSLLEAHIVDAYTVPAQSELTGDWWTNLAGKQSNSFGLILPRCARQTAFSKTAPHYRIGLDSERLVQSQRPHSEQQMFDAVPRFGPTKDNKTTSRGISDVAPEAFCTSVNQRFVFIGVLDS